jgi:Na+-transporting NADH:ubiquinone oxidoreductase subunit C
MSEGLEKADDKIKIRRREHYSFVYLVNDDQGLSKVILPIRGYGLWSTLYGFLALESDLNSVAGIGYYQHGETPGLGGEVDNPNWKAKWTDNKRVYGADGAVKLTVLKGSVTAGSADENYQVDGLSGATLTTNGVDNMIKFWLGDSGFGPFLKNLKEKEA